MRFTNLIKIMCVLCCLSLAVPMALAQEDDANDEDSGHIIPVRYAVNVAGTAIDVYYYKPNGAGKFPLMILSHGSPRNASERVTLGPTAMSKQAEVFVAEGIAVAVPIRRGYGVRGGAWAENYGGCKKADYYDAGLASAVDIRTVAETLSQMPEIDASRIVFVGQSAGGWGSLAAGAQGDVLGVVNFAGGRGSDCANLERDLPAAVARYGETSRVPELWFYSQNDKFFPPAISQRLYQAFTASGGNAFFVSAPPYGDDGHKYIRNIASWKPTVDSFLKKIGFLR